MRLKSISDGLTDRTALISNPLDVAGPNVLALGIKSLDGTIRVTDVLCQKCHYELHVEEDHPGINRKHRHETILSVIEDSKTGMTQRKLANKYGMARSYIWKIIHGKISRLEPAECAVSSEKTPRKSTKRDESSDFRGGIQNLTSPPRLCVLFHYAKKIF